MKTASLAADLAAAISAVDLTDVLTEESPFAAAKVMAHCYLTRSSFVCLQQTCGSSN